MAPSMLLAQQDAVTNSPSPLKGTAAAAAAPGEKQQQTPEYKQSDAVIWNKIHKSLMNTGTPRSPVIIRRAKGTVLYDSQGREILDFTSGQMSSILGHSHPEIVECVSQNVASLDHLLSNMLSEPVADLAELLTSLTPDPLDKTFFLNTGSETTEAAIKIAKCATQKFEIVAFAASYHGLTGAAGAATYTTGRKGGGPTMPGSIVFPSPNAITSPFRKPDGSYDWETEMAFGFELVDRQSVGSLAAFVAEPILSTGGILDLPLGYLKRLSEECKKRSMLLILDEAQTGVGRTGEMWAFERDGIVPDILCLSKTLGAGLPQAAVVTTTEIAEKAVKGGYMILTTHMLDPLTAAVGLKVLEIVIRDNLVARAAAMGAVLRRGLLSLQAQYPVVIDVRGRGLLQGLEVGPLRAGPNENDSDGSTSQVIVSGDKLGTAVGDRAMELGLSCNIVNLPGFGGVFRIAPPLTATEDEINRGIRILGMAFEQVIAEMREQHK